MSSKPPRPPAEGSNPRCENCGSIVTKQYVRVFTPPGRDSPRVCPWCPDRVRVISTGEVRDARAPRRTARQTGSFETSEGTKQ